MKCDWDHRLGGGVVCKRCKFEYPKLVHKICRLPGEQPLPPAPKLSGPEQLLQQIATTLPTDPDHRTLDEIKTLLEIHCQPCDQFTGFGCQDFDGQGSGCNQRQRFIRRLMLRMFGCERWQNGLVSSGPSC